MKLADTVVVKGHQTQNSYWKSSTIQVESPRLERWNDDDMDSLFGDQFLKDRDSWAGTRQVWFENQNQE